jgi:hypothetical protein
MNKNEEWPALARVNPAVLRVDRAAYCIIWMPMLKIYAKTANALKK